MKKKLHGIAACPSAALLPKTCWITGQPVVDGGACLTEDVREQLAAEIQVPYCHRCGATRLAGTVSCPFCPRRRLGIAEIIRAGSYKYPLSELISGFKFRRHWGMAALLADLLCEAWHKAGCPQIDLLVPVPLHWRRRFIRGFNQSEQLAQSLAKKLAVPCVDAVVKRFPTPQQSLAASAHQRAENLRDAFAVHSVNLSSRHIWLIDDVCTTGSTLHAVAGTFASLPPEYRPERISALVLAVTGAKSPI